MKKRYSIYSVFGGLLIFVIVFLTIVIVVTISMKTKEYKLITEGNKHQLERESEALIKLMGSSMSQVAWDYTYWDEFADAIGKDNPDWFKNNISTIITSFRLDYVAVYDTRFKLVHEAASGDYLNKLLIPESALSLFKDTSLVSFYVNTDYGLFRVYGASVHPTSDPSHSNTPASGYLFVSKKWDGNLQEELSTLSGSIVQLSKSQNIQESRAPNSISSTHFLPGWDGNSVGSVVFSRESQILKRYRESTFNIVLLLSLSLLFMLGLYMFAVMKWGINPLKSLITHIEKEDTEGLKNLKSASIEYNKVGTLLAEHFKQKEELISAKRMAEESDRLKSAFLANVSHEIRTPMNGIMGFAALLSEPGISEEERKEYLKIIEESGNRMLSIINDLINISIIDAGQIKILPSHFKINDLMNHIYEFFRHEVEGKGINFDCKLGLSDESEIFTDRDKLYAILINLLKNASKYTHNGSIKFGYILKDNNLLFHVSDTGIGIPAERHAAVFERFIQADDTISRHYEGTGLGLSISKAYVEALGGIIWLESESGKGSIFNFTIPLQLLKKG